MASMRTMASPSREGGDNPQWFPYYQRQLIDRLGRCLKIKYFASKIYYCSMLRKFKNCIRSALEFISHNQPRRPLIQERSNSTYPYKFYGDVTEWKG